MSMHQLDQAELEAGLPGILESPKDAGVLALIVQRPAVNERTVVETGGLIGDSWKARAGRSSRNRSMHADMQLTLMNARAAALVAQDKSRWALAGDQLYVDLDLSVENLPPGSRLRIGEAVVEVTAIPHRGCSKFVQRFGRAAKEFVNSEVGCALNLRGVNARVVTGGRVSIEDSVLVERRGGSDSTGRHEPDDADADA